MINENYFIKEELHGTVTTLISQDGQEVPPGKPGEQRAIMCFTLDMLDSGWETTCLQCVVKGRNEDGTQYIKQNVTMGKYDTPERAQAVHNEAWQAIKDGKATYTFPPA